MEKQKDYLKAHFLSLYCMVVADNDVSPLELQELYRIGHEYYGLTDVEINSAIISEGQAFYNPETLEDKVMYLYQMALIAAADGVIQQEEKVLLEKYVKKIGFHEDNASEISEFLMQEALAKTGIEDLLTRIID